MLTVIFSPDDQMPVLGYGFSCVSIQNVTLRAQFFWKSLFLRLKRQKPHKTPKIPPISLQGGKFSQFYPKFGHFGIALANKMSLFLVYPNHSRIYPQKLALGCERTLGVVLVNLFFLRFKAIFRASLVFCVGTLFWQPVVFDAICGFYGGESRLVFPLCLAFASLRYGVPNPPCPA